MQDSLAESREALAMVGPTQVIEDNQCDPSLNGSCKCKEHLTDLQGSVCPLTAGTVQTKAMVMMNSAMEKTAGGHKWIEHLTGSNEKVTNGDSSEALPVSRKATRWHTTTHL